MRGWAEPSKVGILEALGCVADNRIRHRNGNAEVGSSGGKRRYGVVYDAKSDLIGCDDDQSQKGVVGYPIIAYLMLEDRLTYDDKIAINFRGIDWEKLGKKYDSDAKIEEAVKRIASEKGVGRVALDAYCERVLNEVRRLRTGRLETSH